MQLSYIPGTRGWRDVRKTCSSNLSNLWLLEMLELFTDTTWTRNFYKRPARWCWISSFPCSNSFCQKSSIKIQARPRTRSKESIYNVARQRRRRKGKMTIHHAFSSLSQWPQCSWDRKRGRRTVCLWDFCCPFRGWNERLLAIMSKLQNIFWVRLTQLSLSCDMAASIRDSFELMPCQA